MSHTLTVVLPAQPATGVGAFFTPFGGDGKSAPIGEWNVSMTQVGDAGGGAVSLQVVFDPRYISIVSYCMASVTADGAGGDFQCQLRDNVTSVPNISVVGVLPTTAEGFTATNSVYLWYPPLIWLSGNGLLQTKYPNVDATETYNLDCSIFVFDRNVRQLQAIQWLNMVRVGVNSPPAAAS